MRATRVWHLPFPSLRNERRGGRGPGDGGQLLKMRFYKNSADPRGLEAIIVVDRQQVLPWLRSLPSFRYILALLYIILVFYTTHAP
jgi:hypothetical protein